MVLAALDPLGLADPLAAEPEALEALLAALDAALFWDAETEDDAEARALDAWELTEDTADAADD